MKKKKGFLASLFGGNKCDCGMSIEDESSKKSAKKKGGCCDMQIVEETTPSCCCDKDCAPEEVETQESKNCCGSDQ